MTRIMPATNALELPGGRRVCGGSVRRPPADIEGVDLAVVLTGLRPRRALAQKVRWVRWPDFGLPVSTSDAIATLTEAYDTAVDRRVLLACGSGIGRTGTGLAFLAMFDGLGPDDAVTWVRERYHRRAVETPWQRRWLRQLATVL